MKFNYLKIILILIGFYSLHLLGITNNLKLKVIQKINLRFLSDNSRFDKSSRTNKEDIKSIENCENLDYKYFFEYITGYNVTFDKNIDPDRAVSNY